jgi:AcrR family transcriptional regulator
MAPTQTDKSHDEVMTERILLAAMECFSQLGIAKTSIQDVARVAEVSRGTVYRYFPDRQSLIDAGVEFGAMQYYADAAKAMGRKDTLAEQIGAFAEVVARTQLEHRTRDRLMDGDATLMRMVVADRDRTLERHTAFLRPYVEGAVTRNEVAAGLDVDEACEWLARIIMSLTMLQSAMTFSYRKPASVAAFVERYAIGGLREPGAS